MTRLDAAFVKFDAIKAAVVKRPYMVKNFSRKEAFARALLRQHSAKTKIVSGIHKEFRVWVSDLLETDEKRLVIREFERIDAETGRNDRPLDK